MSGMIGQGKQRKRNLLLALIRSRSGASKATLKEWSGLSMESVIRYVDEMAAEGLITTTGYSRAAVGRKASLLAIRPEGCYFLGVYFSARGMTAVVMDFGGAILERCETVFPADVTAVQVIDDLVQHVKILMEHMGEKRERLLGVGVATPGLVDRKNGISLRYVSIAGWDHIPLKALLEERLGVPVVIEHTLKCTALATARLRENWACSHLLFVLVSRGVGMAVLANGEIYSGAANLSGEIGHIFAANNGVRCRCGRMGCLETVAGSTEILHRVEKGVAEGRFPVLRTLMKAGEGLTLGGLLRASEMGDEDALQEIAAVGKGVGDAVATAVTLFNPDRLILSGEIAAAPGFSQAMEQQLQARCFPESLKELSCTFRQQDHWFDAQTGAALVYEENFGLPPEDRRMLTSGDAITGSIDLFS